MLEQKSITKNIVTFMGYTWQKVIEQVKVFCEKYNVFQAKIHKLMKLWKVSNGLSDTGTKWVKNGTFTWRKYSLPATKLSKIFEKSVLF